MTTAVPKTDPIEATLYEIIDWSARTIHPTQDGVERLLKKLPESIRQDLEAQVTFSVTERPKVADAVNDYISARRVNSPAHG